MSHSKISPCGALLAIASILAFVPALAQDSPFIGKWIIALDAARYIDYGILEIESNDGELHTFIDGGPVNVLGVNGTQISFDFDWTDGGDRLHVPELSGELVNGELGGLITEHGEQTGTWSAMPWNPHPDTGAEPSPVDISGTWLSLSRGTHKDAFELTPTGEAINAAYDRSLDDPHLRCVTGGMIRMEDGPFGYEILQRDDHILILYEYFHEVRRIWMDGRAFPEDIANAYLTMGYSIGHWEGSTLVIETRGMKPTVWDASGMPVSTSAVVIERKYLDAEHRLHTDYTLRDPSNYIRPVYRHAYRELGDDVELNESSCDPHSFYRSLDLEDRLEDYWGRSGNRF